MDYSNYKVYNYESQAGFLTNAAGDRIMSGFIAPKENDDPSNVYGYKYNLATGEMTFTDADEIPVSLPDFAAAEDLVRTTIEESTDINLDSCAWFGYSPEDMDLFRERVNCSLMSKSAAGKTAENSVPGIGTVTFGIADGSVHVDPEYTNERGERHMLPKKLLENGNFKAAVIAPVPGYENGKRVYKFPFSGKKTGDKPPYSQFHDPRLRREWTDDGSVVLSSVELNGNVISGTGRDPSIGTFGFTYEILDDDLRFYESSGHGKSDITYRVPLDVQLDVMAAVNAADNVNVVEDPHILYFPTDMPGTPSGKGFRTEYGYMPLPKALAAPADKSRRIDAGNPDVESPSGTSRSGGKGRDVEL